MDFLRPDYPQLVRDESGVRGIEWIRQEEWTGARKVLLDKDEVFS